MSAVSTNKKRERQTANQAPARHSGEGRNPPASSFRTPRSGDPESSASASARHSGEGRNPVAVGSIRSDEARADSDGQKWNIDNLLKPRSEKASPAQFPELPYVGLEHVEPHTTNLLGTIPAGQMRSTAKRFYAGDVLYSRLRPYLNKVWYADRDGLCSAEFIVLPGNEKVDANFLRYRLSAADFVTFANSLNAGDRPRVDFDQIASFELPRFDLAKQRAAVAEIEKQFTRLDAGVAALRRVQANLKRYRAAVLKAACEGRLVPIEAELARAEGRTFETGEQLLARILADRRKNWRGRGKYKEPAASDATNLPPLPDGWAWATIDQLSTRVVDGTHHTPTYVSEGIAFISVKDIRDGKVHFEDCKYVSLAAHEELSKRCNAELGDVLITKSGTIGRIAVVQTGRPFSLFVSVALIKPVRGFFDPKFLALLLEGYIGSISIAQVVKGGLLKNLHLEDLRVVTVSIPPLAEQSRIVAEVERSLSVIAELEAAVAVSFQRAARLRQSILWKAFHD